MADQPELLHQPDQLIVDLQHLDVLQGTLKDLGVEHSNVVDEMPALGLARLSGLVDDTQQLIDLDSLLAEVRLRCAADRSGWVPLMGKNRWIDRLIGAGHKPMEHAAPTPASESEFAPLTAAPDAGAGVRIGIVDTPHTTPASALSSGAAPIPYRAGHSIFVASLIQRQAPMATLSYRGPLDSETGRADSWETAVAMLELAEDGIDILNLSLGSYASGGPPLVISRAIERLTPDILVVAAAGNHGAFLTWEMGRTRTSAVWPAAIPPVIAVRAVDDAGTRPEWSPDRPWITCSAPGVGVVGAYLDGDVQLPDSTAHFNGFARWDGTSFSAATVSGAVAAAITADGKASALEAFLQLKALGGLVKPFQVTP